MAQDLVYSHRLKSSCDLSPDWERQMIAIGGIPANINSQYFTTDSWTQGLKTFDLTDMEWKDSFDAGAAAYKTLKQIKDYIERNGQYPAQWDDQDLERWVTGGGCLLPPVSWY
jgi:hypothetical protein